MKSIWTETTQIPKRNALPGNRKTEVAVIGAGMAGILTAYYLQQRGFQVIVLEANRIGSGQTANTTAKITSQHNLIYHKLLNSQGKEKAAQYANANQTALAEYKKLIAKNSIDCHYEERPSYLYSDSLSEPLRREAAAAKRLGISAEFVSETALPFPIHGAVRFHNQGQFHPLEFLRHLTTDLTIYENTRVLSVKGGQIHTDHGAVSAQHIVFACHYPFINIPGFYFARMYQERSYVLAVEQTLDLDGMYLGIDPNGISLRSYDGLLLLGGGSHRSGTKPPIDPYSLLHKTAKKYWPNSKEAAFWSAQDCMTLDGIPYIGRFCASAPNWYVATGFEKWGMTTSMVSALLISDMIAGKKNPWEEVFSPQRFSITISAKTMAEHVVKSASGLILGRTPGIARCSHLGCKLVWNATDKSWDCPCHGSRFGPNGEILNGPAQCDASFID